MQNIRVARDFCEHYLPEKTKKLIDLNTLQMNSASFVDEALKSSESDILYQADLIHSKEKAFIYILAEHQRKPDQWIPFRLVKYMCEISTAHLKQHPKTKKLPLIFPVVFYNGQKPYKKSMSFFDLFGDQKESAIDLFMNAFHLVDVNQIPDSVMRQHRWSGLMEIVMKQEKMRNVFKLWQNLIKEFASILQEGSGTSYFMSMLTYSLHTSDTKNHAYFFATIRKQLAQTHQSTEKAMMTIAERLRQDGRKEGLKQVKTIAARVRQEERLELAVRLFEEFQDLKLVAKITKLPIKKLKVLLNIC